MTYQNTLATNLGITSVALSRTAVVDHILPSVPRTSGDPERDFLRKVKRYESNKGES